MRKIRSKTATMPQYILDCTKEHAIINADQAENLLKEYRTLLFLVRKRGMHQLKYLHQAEVVYNELKSAGFPLKKQHRI